eukprot:63220-Hanusia_phi.AAC.1
MTVVFITTDWKDAAKRRDNAVPGTCGRDGEGCSGGGACSVEGREGGDQREGDARRKWEREREG